jgi:homoserine O-succinyltransferase
MPRSSGAARPSRPLRGHAGPLTIGLVNNMPDAALKSTERQFRELIADAAGGLPVRVRTFSFPALPRSDRGRQYIRENHEDVAALRGLDLDGLIVTGAEPRAERLEDEPYWPDLTRLVDWAAEHTISTLFSCLAGHGAAHYLDGIERRPRGAKLSGVFDCGRVADHPIVAGGAARWSTPHSRYNELPEEDLVAHGYRILSRSAEAGADIFVKRDRSLFVFLQGHPEYDANSLLLEYRRDVGRYLSGERDTYPDMPTSYFDEPTTEALLWFRGEGLRRRDTELMPGFQMLLAEQAVSNRWRPAALHLFSNWLGYLAEGRPHRPSLARPHLADAAEARVHG